MILAAGRGERLMPLTAETPKALVPVADKPIIAYALDSLAAAGIGECVINLHYKGKLIEEYAQDGSAWGLKINYSREEKHLDTGGGIRNALPLLGPDPFLLMNCDLLHDADLGKFIAKPLPENSLAHLLLVETPRHCDDFALNDDAQIVRGGTLTYSGIGIINPEIFADETRECFPLRDMVDKTLSRRILTGEIHQGEWLDIGTPEALALASEQMSKKIG